MEGESIVMTVSGVLADVSTVLSSVITSCTDNKITAAIIGMSLVGVGIGLFRKFLRVGR